MEVTSLEDVFLMFIYVREVLSVVSYILTSLRLGLHVVWYQWGLRNEGDL